MHRPPEHDGQRHPPVGRTVRGFRHVARPILIALVIAVATTVAVWWFVRLGDEPGVAIGQPAPRIVGTTLDGQAIDLASYAGRPVVLNFWGPTCIPCRDEFPLLEAKLAEHADDKLAIVGVLTDDPVPLARDFVAEFGATWPTVEDPTRPTRGVPGPWPAADVLHRRVGCRALHPDRRGPRHRFRDALRPDRAMTAPAVIVEGAGKRYGERTVLDDVSVMVAAGELVAVLGPNGAGKTTTVEIIEGFRPPTPARCGSSGRIRHAVAARCEPGSG